MREISAEIMSRQKQAQPATICIHCL
ncbi:MAG: hypothetical protein IAC06_02625 [Bacteroidetes bacterium]|uniref:Uncharacterized protein n=1 Tax=Candidatus Cryptobacteroides intestinavium TaxID=2840766 RepID=A0A9D9ES82_9BACT|nr:hypothetical protein [Candidatus Cryptobacteroides intestinavium]